MYICMYIYVSNKSKQLLQLKSTHTVIMWPLVPSALWVAMISVPALYSIAIITHLLHGCMDFLKTHNVDKFTCT